MRIDGTWAKDENGVFLPLIHAELLGEHGVWVACTFLVDTGAETTVIAADTLRQLGLPTQPSPRRLQGIGGIVDSVAVDTKIKFIQPDGSPAIVRHLFDALTDDGDSDISLLGREVLGAFSVIVDRPGRTIHLISPPHRYVLQ